MQKILFPLSQGARLLLSRSKRWPPVIFRRLVLFINDLFIIVTLVAASYYSEKQQASKLSLRLALCHFAVSVFLPCSVCVCDFCELNFVFFTLAFAERCMARNKDDSAQITSHKESEILSNVLADITNGYRAKGERASLQQLCV